jgi:hypothetical protein
LPSARRKVANSPWASSADRRNWSNVRPSRLTIALRLAAVDRGQRHLLILQRAVGLAARAPHRPPRSVAPGIAALEVDLGPPRGRTAPEQRADVLRAERRRIIVAAPDDDPAVIRQPRRPVEQRDAQRIEQRALARAGVADDREHARIRERRTRQVDLELAGEAREVAPPDREDPHDSSTFAAGAATTGAVAAGAA